MGFLLRLLTWWNGQTIGTQLFTARNGVFVGLDLQGNIYYETRDKNRRWVIYRGLSEASSVPPDWHGWLHHIWKEPPTEKPLLHKSWEKQHEENVTGTIQAYSPSGSLRRAQATKKNDYEPWLAE